MIIALNGTITKNYSSFALTSPPTVLVMWPYSQAMTKHPCPPFTLVCVAATFYSWPRIPLLSFIRLRLVTAGHVVTRNDFTPTLASVSRVIGQSTNAAICVLVNALLGQLTVKFILSYEGKNPAILRLQMRLMCWDMDIEHRNDIHLADADYFSQLGSDLCYNPLLCDYIECIDAIKWYHPSPSALPSQKCSS